jgi:hypothetical protein
MLGDLDGLHYCDYFIYQIIELRAATCLLANNDKGWLGGKLQVPSQRLGHGPWPGSGRGTTCSRSAAQCGCCLML